MICDFDCVHMLIQMVMSVVCRTVCLPSLFLRNISFLQYCLPVITMIFHFWISLSKTWIDDDDDDFISIQHVTCLQLYTHSLDILITSYQKWRGCYYLNFNWLQL